MKPSSLPSKLRVLLRLCPVRPPLTSFDFRHRSGAQTINTLRPPETLFQWTLMLVGKHSHSHSRATDAERQDTRHPTVLPDSTSESYSKYRWPPDLLRGSSCGTWCKTPRAHSGGWGAGSFPLQRVNSTPSLSYHNCFSVLPTVCVPLMKQLNHLQMCKITYPKFQNFKRSGQ